jgi:hypothetical protein
LRFADGASCVFRARFREADIGNCAGWCGARLRQISFLKKSTLTLTGETVKLTAQPHVRMKPKASFWHWQKARNRGGIGRHPRLFCSIVCHAPTQFKRTAGGCSILRSGNWHYEIEYAFHFSSQAQVQREGKRGSSIEL